MGLNDKDGNELLPCIYDEIPDYDDDGYVRFIKNGIYGTIDLNGNITITHNLGLTHLGVFHEGTARAEKNGRWGLVDTKGNTVCGFRFIKINAWFDNKYKAFTEDYSVGFLSADGTFTDAGYKSTPQKFSPGRDKKAFVKRFDVKIKTQKYYSLFSKHGFDMALMTWMPTAECAGMKFFCRDTNVEIDISQYGKGTIVRPNGVSDCTKVLLRPPHSTRFIIATTVDTGVIPALRYLPRPFKGNVIHPDARFIVTDVQRESGVTQIVLLQIPEAAVTMARNNNVSIDFSTCRALVENINSDAAANLKMCLGTISDEYSLPAYREDEARLPFVPVDASVPQKQCFPAPDTAFFREYSRIIHADDPLWRMSTFTEIRTNTLRIASGDIARLQAEAIVNSVNNALTPNGTLDSWLRNVAGKDLENELRSIGHCNSGQCIVTEGYGLHVKKIIHTVAPLWGGGHSGEAKQLEECYENALDIVEKLHIRSVAFPALATGTKRYPCEEAAQVALNAIIRRLKSGKCRADIIICCYTDGEAETYNDILARLSYRDLL